MSFGDAVRRVGVVIATPASAATGLLLLAGILRFYHLGGRSLWLDEVFTAQIGRLPTLSTVLDETHAEPDQMPLFYIIVWALRGLGGMEWVVRLPAAVAGTLSVPALYLLGAKAFRPRVGFTAALLAAILPFSIWYGQEARAYSLLMLLTTVQMYFAYCAVGQSRPGPWAGLAVSSVLNLYTHYMALAATAAVFVFVWLSLVVEAGMLAGARRRTREWKIVRRQLSLKIGFALAASTLTVLAYLPWWPYLRAFLASGSVGLGRVSTVRSLSLHDLRVLLDAFNLSGVLLVLLLGGLAAVVYHPMRDSNSRRASLLVLCWISIPAAGLLFELKGSALSLVPRYYIFLYPVALLCAAAGVETLIDLTSAVGGSVRRPATLVYGLALVVLLQQTLPATANSYAVPKDDYRGAADRIIAARPPRSVVLSLGGGDAFVSRSLGYYFWLRRSPVRVVNGSELDSVTAARLKDPHARVWGAVFTSDGSKYFTAGPPPGFDAVPLVGITLLRPRPTVASPEQEATSLLQWGSRFQPELEASASLLRVLTGSDTLASNVLPPANRTASQPVPDAWWLTPGAQFRAKPDEFVFTSTGTQINAVATASPVTQRREFILTWDYRDASATQPLVFVVANGANGQTINTFPNGAGYVCSRSRAWRHAAFALRVPPGTESLTIWLRSEGAGTAEFTHVELRSVRR